MTEPVTPSPSPQSGPPSPSGPPSVETLVNYFSWARRNFWLAFVSVIFGFCLYAGYAFIGGYANKFGESFVQYNNFKHQIASYTVIDTLLHEYLVKYEASRISIARFHNSIKDVGNNELYFVTFENDIAAPGVTLESNPTKDISAHTYSDVLPNLLDNKTIFVLTKDLPANDMRDQLSKVGTKMALFIPIKDLSDHLIGMVVMSWIGDMPQDPVLQEDMAKTMSEVASRIGAYLNAKE